MRYCKIGHERQGNCGDRSEKYILCAGAHSANEHKCGVDGCKIRKGKLCVHVTARCANCQGNHQANLTRCPARQKAETEAQQKRAAKIVEPTIEVSTPPEPNEKEKNPIDPSQEMDEEEDWAKGPTPEYSGDFASLESRDHTPDY